MAVCCWCESEIRKQEYPRQIGEAHFWKDFHLYASQSKEIDRNGVRKANKRFRKSHAVCQKCHFRIRMHLKRSRPRASVTSVEPNQPNVDSEFSTTVLIGNSILEAAQKLDVVSTVVTFQQFTASGSVVLQKLVTALTEVGQYLRECDPTEGNVDWNRLNLSSDETQLRQSQTIADVSSEAQVPDNDHISESPIDLDELISDSNGIDVNATSVHEILPESSESTQQSICSTASSASTIYFLKQIQTCGATQCRCMICGKDERHRIPRLALLQVWISKQVFIPVNNRTCSSHLNNGIFNHDALERIDATKYGVSMSGEELGKWIIDITTKSSSQNLMSDIIRNQMSNTNYEMLFGITKVQFLDLYSTYIEPSTMRNSAVRHKKEALAMFLLFMRKNLDQDMISFIFKCSQSVVSDAIEAVSTILEKEFVPKNLGYGATTRVQAVNEHGRKIINGIFDIQENELALIADGTYIYIEQPQDYKTQRLLFSGQKKRNLAKVMMLVLPSGRIVEAAGAFGANGTNNDATILQYMLEKTKLKDFLMEGDKMIVDRGFRDIKDGMEEAGYTVYMPELLKKGVNQFQTDEANRSRKVTKVRWIVESVNGRVKNVFRFFMGVVEGRHTPNLMKYLRIACALLNKYYPPLLNDLPAHEKIVERIRALEHKENELQKWVVSKNIEGRLLVVDWKKADASVIADFPKLSWDELEEFFLGVYQLKQGRRYIRQHLNQTGDFEIQVFRHPEEDGSVISAKLQSRFRSNVKHLLFVQYNTNQSGLDAIKGVYCRCQVGARTVGSCSHVSAVLQYMALIRHEGLPEKRRSNKLIVIDAKSALRETDGESSEEES